MAQVGRWGADQIRAIAVNANGLFVAGFDSTPGNRQWRIEKRTLASGALDISFDFDGVITQNLSTGLDEIRALEWDANALYVAGFDSAPGNAQWRLEKRQTSDGNLVSSFGTGGVDVSNPGDCSDEAYGIAKDASALYIVGKRGVVNLLLSCSAYSSWRVEKRLK